MEWFYYFIKQNKLKKLIKLNFYCIYKCSYLWNSAATLSIHLHGYTLHMVRHYFLKIWNNSAFISCEMYRNETDNWIEKNISTTNALCTLNQYGHDINLNWIGLYQHNGHRPIPSTHRQVTPGSNPSIYLGAH